jgi:hypothetical protein
LIFVILGRRIVHPLVPSKRGGGECRSAWLSKNLKGLIFVELLENSSGVENG